MAWGNRKNNRSGVMTRAYLDHQRGHLIARLGNRCGICGGENPEEQNRNLAIDHDAQTLMVRGLLCQECNLGLGKFRDSIGLLEAAIAYLKDPPAQRQA